MAGRMTAAALLMVGWGHSALAEGWAEWKDLDDKDLQARCEALAKTAVPAADLPSGQDRKDLAGCGQKSGAGSLSYYYGAGGSKADYAKARKCALMEREGPWQMSVAYGPDVVMMIYANGQGVARNYDLARRMACEFGGALAELQGRLQHIDVMQARAEQKMEKADATSSHIDTCDDVTSGVMTGLCSDMQSRLKNDKQTRKENAVLASWPSEQQAAFKDLRAKAEAFAGSHAENEGYLGGTAWMDEMTEEKDNTIKLYRDGLALLEEGKPLPNSGDFAKSDQSLNATYKEALKKKFMTGHGDHTSTTAKTIKQTQLLWLKYRDAYVAFAALRYPQRSADEIKAWLTELRIGDLNGLPVDDDAVQ